MIFTVGMCVSTTAFGHVHLITPTGDDVLLVGSTVDISWQITVPHDTENWDLYYTTTGQNGTWLPIVLDIPLGDSSQGSIHMLGWVVPNTPSEDVWVRVVMDNTTGDYDDTNDQPITIVVGNSCPSDINTDGLINVGDLLLVIKQWGFVDSPADITGDGVVNIGDLLLIVSNWGSCGG